MNELKSALKLARRILDLPPDGSSDSLALLARQLVRQHKVNRELHEALAAAQDPTGDLVQANRDVILEIHQEALRRIKYCLQNDKSGLIPLIVDAARSFHPMHPEGWSWPEGSDYR